MRVIAASALKAFCCNGPQSRDAKGPTLAWYRDVVRADWAKPSDMKEQFGMASVLKGDRVIFNIAGNKYHLVVWINYPLRVVYVRFIGTHRQYQAIDPQTI